MAAGVGTSACRSPQPARPAPPLPQVAGSLTVTGLSAPVRIVRDTWGVPHIYADTQADLFFAQGFVQAQDRLFQMDLWRRSAQGRLSEVLGANFIERDAMTRRMQYRGDMRAEWDSYGAGHRGHRDRLRAGDQRVGRHREPAIYPRSSPWPAGAPNTGAPRTCSIVRMRS